MTTDNTRLTGREAESIIEDLRDPADRLWPPRPRPSKLGLYHIGPTVSPDDSCGSAGESDDEPFGFIQFDEPELYPGAPLVYGVAPAREPVRVFSFVFPPAPKPSFNALMALPDFHKGRRRARMEAMADDRKAGNEGPLLENDRQLDDIEAHC